MIRPSALRPRPAFTLTILAGVIATLLFSALIYLMPAVGLRFVDIPRLVGGIFTSDPDAALWLGYWIFFLTGTIVAPLLLAFTWPILPGRSVGFRGALLKGLLAGAILWIGSGLLLPLLALVNQLPGQELENPGFFALNAGLLSAAWVLLGHLVYGLALALVAAMSQGIDPIDIVGWMGYSTGDTREVALMQHGQRERQ